LHRLIAKKGKDKRTREEAKKRKTNPGGFDEKRGQDIKHKRKGKKGICHSSTEDVTRQTNCKAVGGNGTVRERLMSSS